jgi:threonylcarbamoyladenosine tRNA methylthiotransferase MtaB
MDAMGSVAVYTLGCKLNQLESEALAGAFVHAGFSLVCEEQSANDISLHAAADIIIINTCTVTSKADQKARRLIRKALRDNPLACVIVTGCYAQLDPGDIESLAEDGPAFPGGKRLFVLKGGQSSGAAKSNLLELPRYLQIAGAPGCEFRSLVEAWAASHSPAATGVFGFRPESFSFHTRGYLKIQDGCDNHCTYCRVRLARGASVSIPAEQALSELMALEAKGYAELMITGVNITQYRDNGGCGDLAALLERLLAATTSVALRLSSLEPEGISERLAAILQHPRIRPHFHLSVQSGSPAILARMGRGYGPETVEKAAALLRSVKDNPFLACDIITGFPGETEPEFEKTLALCKKTGFAWIHAFPYSKRPGTPACSFGDSVCERDAVRRVEILRELARQEKQRYAQSWTGREINALVERGTGEKDGHCRAVSDNYLKLLVKYPGGKAPLPGTALRCRITKVPAPGGKNDHSADAEAAGILLPENPCI